MLFVQLPSCGIQPMKEIEKLRLDQIKSVPLNYNYNYNYNYFRLTLSLKGH